jgi:predicted trehalose synthase
LRAAELRGETASAKRWAADRAQSVASTIRLMNSTQRIVVAVLVVAAVLIGVAQRSSAGLSRHVYILRIGDAVVVPLVGQVCTFETEGGAPELFCSRKKGVHHQVTFFHDNILA